MADNRPWAKIDTGYIMNPKWFQVERIIADGMALANGKTDGTCHQLAISNAVRCARDAHLASILYSAQNQTDGIFPVRAIKALVSVQTDEEEAAVTALFVVGLWINHPGGMAEVRDYLEHQTPASLAKKRSEAGKKGAARRWDADGKSHESANGKTMASANAEEKRREEKRSNNPPTPQGGNRAQQIPDTWTPTQSHYELAHSLHVNCDQEAQKMRDWALSKGATGKDWDARFRNWLRRAAELAPPAQGGDRFDGWERAAQLVNQQQLRAIEGGTA